MLLFDSKHAFPANNAWDVPTLDLLVQPESALIPFAAWGSLPRTGTRQVSWHFYVDDYRFTALLKHPEQVPDSAPLAATELNFSVYEQTPAAGVLCATWHKRWLARFWQSHGVPVYVDLNVPERHQETNLIGVPRGWRAYSTRGYESRTSSLEAELMTARMHAAGNSPIFVVFGGGKRVREFCQREGCVHIPYGGQKNVYSEAAKCQKE